MTTYAKNTLHVPSSLAFTVSLVSNGLQIIGALLGGWLADRLGRKPIMIWPQLVVLVLTYPAFLWIVQEPGAWSLLFGFGILSFIGSLPFTAFYAAFTEALPQNIRGGVFATIYAVAIATFGGTAQLVVHVVAARDGRSAGAVLVPAARGRGRHRRDEPDAGDRAGRRSAMILRRRDRPPQSISRKA